MNAAHCRLRGIFALSALLCALLTHSASAATRSWVDAPDGTPLCVYETGKTDGPTLVLLHGFSQSYGVFKRQFESTLANDYRLVAFDLRGHGCSGKPSTNEAYATPEIWARDVKAVLDAKQVTKPILVGWSYGAFIIADYVRTFGSRDLAGVVLVGSNAGMIAEAADQAARRKEGYERAAAANPFSTEIERGINDGRGFVKFMSAKPLPADIDTIMFTANQQLPAYANRAMTTRKLENVDLIPKFDLPALLVVGERDFSNPADVIAGLAARMPNAKVVRFAESGHSTFAEEPERFNSVVREFAESVKP